MADFENIIGYDYVKKAFTDMLVTMNQSKDLMEAGVRVPHSLLLRGSDHRGKAFMAKEFVKASGRTEFECGFDTMDDETAETLTKLFFNPPPNKKYIINLTDLDLIVAEKGELFESILFVMYEDARKKELQDNFFFIATVEDYDSLPPEMKEFFHDMIFIDLPHPDDTFEIYHHLLTKKNIFTGMGEYDATKALAIKSYHSIEQILDKALILEQRKNPTDLLYQLPIFISADSFSDAVLDFFYNKGLHSGKRDPLGLERFSFHEAGHALAAELLQPGIVGFAALNEDTGSESGGGVFLCRNWKRTAWENEADVVMNLAGKAAEEIAYGKDFGGAANDIRDSYKRLVYQVVCDGIYGLEFTHPCRSNESISGGLLSKQEKAAIQARLIKDFSAAKKLITDHRKALDKIAKALWETGFVPASVIQKAIEEG